MNTKTKMPISIVRKLTLLEAIIDVAKDALSWDSVRRTLPFLTSVEEGQTKTHIVSEHAFPIHLYNQNRDVNMGETLCGRTGPRYRPSYPPLPSCPGCLHIGRGIVARELMNDFPEEYFEAKRG